MFRFALVSSLLLAVPPYAAAVGRQELVVTGREAQVWDLTKEYFTYRGGTIADGMSSSVSFSASSDAQIVVYDHWEDGFEADPLNPTQLTTLRFVLDKGQAVSLASTRTAAYSGSAASG